MLRNSCRSSKSMGRLSLRFVVAESDQVVVVWTLHHSFENTDFSTAAWTRCLPELSSQMVSHSRSESDCRLKVSAVLEQQLHHILVIIIDRGGAVLAGGHKGFFSSSFGWLAGCCSLYREYDLGEKPRFELTLCLQLSLRSIRKKIDWTPFICFSFQGWSLSWQQLGLLICWSDSVENFC
jgi:hypothetical protein